MRSHIKITFVRSNFWEAQLARVNLQLDKITNSNRVSKLFLFLALVFICEIA